MQVTKHLIHRQRKIEKRNHQSKIKNKLNRIKKQNGNNLVLQLFKTINHFFSGPIRSNARDRRLS